MRGCRCFRVCTSQWFRPTILRFRPLAGMSVFPGHSWLAPSTAPLMGFRPLAGMSVFPGVRSRSGTTMPTAFQTPCGDVGVSGLSKEHRHANSIPVSDPLRGCRCFRAHPWRDAWPSPGSTFQTPCGDVGVSGVHRGMEPTLKRRVFQTPCGDVGVSGGFVQRWRWRAVVFQTPCGDVGVSGLAHPPQHAPECANVSDPLRGCRCFRAIAQPASLCTPMISVSDPLRGCRCFRVRHDFPSRR